MTDELNKELSRLTINVAIPIIWHDRDEGFPKILHGATCFILQFDQGFVGVTANHVVMAYEAALAGNPRVVCQLRYSPPFELLDAIIDRSAECDIATFSVAEEMVAKLGAITIDCRATWPPPEPQFQWKISVCGFPEDIRIVNADRSAIFQAYGAVACVDAVTQDEIIMVYDPVTSTPTAGVALMPPLGFNMSGCSGGPVLMYAEMNGLIRWFPVALIAQGPCGEEKQGIAQDFDMIRLSRIHVIQRDGTIAKRDDNAGGWLPR